MRYKIEYLDVCDDEESAFLATFCDGTLEDARARAYAHRPECEEAEGFLIRDFAQDGRVVLVQAFED